MGEVYEGGTQRVIRNFDGAGDDDSQETDVDALLESIGQPVAKSGRKCVLLVDDSKIQLRSLSSALAGRYDVQVANSGMKALTLIGKRVPDIIFLDYEMPMCDGKMTLQMIREVDEAKDIPVVFLTGMRDKEHIKEVLELKPAGYLLKPPNLDTIFQTIEDVLAKKKQ